MERLFLRMLLLPAVLAADLPRAEETSSDPSYTPVLVLSQIHRSGLPAGGALHLETERFLNVLFVWLFRELLALRNYFVLRFCV